LQQQVLSLNERVGYAEKQVHNLSQRPAAEPMPMPTGEIDTEAVMALIQKLR
jgi:hypothetical protein